MFNDYARSFRKLIITNSQRSPVMTGVAILTAIAFTLASVGAQPYGRQPPDRLRPTTPAKRRASQTLSATTGQMTQMPLVAPVFIADNNFASKLILVNRAAIDTFADVVLRAADGTEITRQRVNFAPHSQQPVDIGGLLASVVARVTSGSILVVPSSDLNGPAVTASLSITYLGSREPNYIDEELAMPNSQGSQVLRAVTDPAETSPLLAVTSLAESTQHVSIQCLSDNGVDFSNSVELAPGQTLFTEACASGTANNSDFDATWQHAEGDSRAAAGNAPTATGIALSSDAMPGSFAAFALSPPIKRRHISQFRPIHRSQNRVVCHNGIYRRSRRCHHAPPGRELCPANLPR